MSVHGHTKGPWEAVGRYVRTARSGSAGVEVAALPLDTGISAEQRDADARLIAAAPALLAALEALTDPEGHLPHGLNPKDCTGECREARAAIAKARGAK